MPECDVLIVGAGPAGIAAACTAAESGARVLVLDDNFVPGGQIWRGGAPEATPWIERLRRSGAEVRGETRAVGYPAPGVLLAETKGEGVEIAYRRLILATGARELFLPFPGWTLPNVTGAGGLQALVKSGLPIAGKRVLIAGSGPLLFAVAAYLKAKGAQLLAIVEQAPLAKLARFAAAGKFWQAVRLQSGLLGVPLRAGCWPVKAEGQGILERVTLSNGRAYECDYLACGYGLVPNLELAQMAGCELEEGVVATGSHQETSVPGVYCAGELTGIGGLDRSLVEGQIAGHAAAGDDAHARALFPVRDRQERFGHALEECFALRDELRVLATADTIVCRCEDVTLGRILEESNWTAAKLQTRCGMGPCQGRICGAALEFIAGYPRTSVRPPSFPARMSTLAGRPR
jgi:D-hydroxyproline dehydrogenase subunit alpha